MQAAEAINASGLLSARRERPCRRAAEKRDELAPFQLIKFHSIPASQGRIAGYRIASGQSAGSWEARREAIAPAEVWAAGAKGSLCVGRVSRREPEHYREMVVDP